MFNIITRKTEDPQDEFGGIWLNKESGSIWIWDGKPLLLGFTKEGKLVSAKTFTAEFVFTDREKNQKYEYEFDYKGFPISVITNVEKNDYQGTEVLIDIGGEYGAVSQEGTVLVQQRANVCLGDKIKLSCKPTRGRLKIELTVLSYE